jgi:tetratricopeptide (TPR) repeat protein
MALGLLSVIAPQPEYTGLSNLRAAERDHVAGKRSAAEAHYHRALQTFPEDPLPRYRLAALYQQWGYPERGLLALEAAAQQHPLPARLKTLQLRLLADAGHWEELASTAEGYLAHDPNSPAALAHLVQAQLRQQQCTVAQSTSQTWYQSAPSEAAAQRTWGVLSLPHTHVDAATVLCEADAALCATLTGCDDPATCQLPLGQALFRQGEPALAACVLRRAVAADPTSGVAHAWLGASLDALGFSREAGTHLERATALDPTSSPAWALLGQHRLRTGDFTGAREALRSAHELDPENPAPCLGMARALAGQSRYEELKPWIDAALERAPNDPEVYKAAAHFYLARNFRQAPYPLQAAEGAVRLAPGDAEAQMLLGWSHLQTGDVRAALAALNRAIDLRPDLAQAHHLRGLALQALERHEEAEAAFVRGADLGYRE